MTNLPNQVSGLVSEATASSTFRRWYALIRLAVIAVPVVGAVPTALNLYYAWKHGIPYSQVSHRLQQYDLWVKNGDCKIDYREIGAGRGAKVNIGACPASGDISIQVSLANGKSIFEWIDFNQLETMGSVAGLFTTAALAAEGPQADRPFSLAQNSSHVVCQGWEGAGKIVRIVNEGGRCFLETISPYQGHADKRSEVPCNTSCPAPKSK